MGEAWRGFVRASARFVLVTGCARPSASPAARTPPRMLPPELAIVTSVFELVASEYVDYAASREGRIDEAELALLRACEADACARSALATDAARSDLATFARAEWPAHAWRVRAALDPAGAELAAAEDILGPRLATDLALTWPRERVRIAITASGTQPQEEEADDGPIDASSPCFEGAAILDCAFERAVRAAAARSELFLAIERERTHLDERGLARTRNVARDVRLHAVGAAVRLLSHPYVPERHFRASRREDPAVFAWLSREWPKRASGAESAADFGARAIRELARDPTE